MRRLGQVLEAERMALLEGDFGLVNELAEEKVALAHSFEETDAHDLESLSEALIRNGALLAAARDGVSMVLSTLKSQRKARESLSSYDSTGKATTISQPQHGTERRF